MSVERPYPIPAYFRAVKTQHSIVMRCFWRVRWKTCIWGSKNAAHCRGWDPKMVSGTTIPYPRIYGVEQEPTPPPFFTAGFWYPRNTETAREEHQKGPLEMNSSSTGGGAETCVFAQNRQNQLLGRISQDAFGGASKTDAKSVAETCSKAPCRREPGSNMHHSGDPRTPPSMFYQ